MLDRIRSLLASEMEIGAAISPLGLDAARQREALGQLAHLAGRWPKLTPLELREIVRSAVQRVEVGADRISVRLDRGAILSLATPNLTAPTSSGSGTEPLTLSAPAMLRRARKGVRLVIGAGAAGRIDEGLVSLVGRAVQRAVGFCPAMTTASRVWRRGLA